MRSEESIQVTISRDHIQAGKAEDIDIRLTNSGPGKCTNVIFSIRLQTGMVLLKGTSRIERSVLDVGESIISTLRVRAGEPGHYRLTSPNFSYQDYRGRSCFVKDFAVDVAAEPAQERVPRPLLSVELQTQKLSLGEWDILHGMVANVGDADAIEVAVHLSGQAFTTEGSGRYTRPVLSPGSSVDLTFHVFARDAGAHVPMHLGLSYRGPDGNRYDDEKTYTVQAGHDRAQASKLTKVLFLGANPPGLPALRIDEEIREIEQEIRLGRERDHFQIHIKAAVRPRDISRALLDVEPDLVHFAGHGGGGEETFVAEGTDGLPYLVPVSGLVDLFKVAVKNVRCVLVNACDTQKLAGELSAALPSAYAIGMCEPVADPSAILFSIGFYQAIAAGRPVEEAFRLGKAQMTLSRASASSPVLWQGGEIVAS